MKPEETFIQALTNEVESSLPNDFTDNHDHLRFGAMPPIKRAWSLKSAARELLRRRGYVHVLGSRGEALAAFKMVAPIADRLEWLYARLADDESRQTLVQTMAYRALGERKVRLPLNTREYWAGVHEVEELSDSTDFIQTTFRGWRLYRTNLSSKGVPVDFYYSAKGTYTQFLLQQYRCETEAGVIEAEPGDLVIDGGACYGDTALYFANMVGPNGRVFSFEFIPSNLEVLERNLQLNPELMQRVVLMRNALWDKSDQPVYYTDNGPGSSVSFYPIAEATGTTTTLAIDDLARRQAVPAVDFIKMDIEGAELTALHGAVETIRRDRPKLVICLYHSLHDFVDIPEFLDSLGLGYRFYIRHFTIHAEETVLFAQADRS